MKCVLLCLVLCFAITIKAHPQRVTLVGIPRSAFNYPYGLNREYDEEGAETSEPDGSVYDPTAENPFYYPNSLTSMMASMQAMMVRLKQEMNELMRRIPENGQEGGEGPIFSLDPSSFDLENAKNKTTSKTEVIDGQEYTVNETVITRAGEEGRSVFRVKTIQIKPKENPDSEGTNESSDVTTKPQVTEPTEIAPTMSKNDEKNEIPAGKIDSSELLFVENSLPDHLNEVDTSNEVELFEPYAVQYHDLSKDILVNDFQKDEAGTLPPDVEFIDVEKLNPNRNTYQRY